MMPMDIRKVVFLDRDGVINRDSAEYIKSWAEFEFLPGSLEALRLLCVEGYSIIVVTNQSGLARRLFSIETLESIHQQMRDQIIDAGGRITDIFYCPHLPGEGCNCRKPKTGMIDKAVAQYGLDPAGAALVGDSAKDILCGRQAGVGRAILVRTGNGLSAELELVELKIAPEYMADDLLAAAHWIIDPPTQAQHS